MLHIGTIFQSNRKPRRGHFSDHVFDPPTKTMVAKATPPNPRIYSPMPSTPIHPETRIGHVHLKVADLERALNFYTGVLGLQLTQRFGNQAAFISAGGYHHHIGLNTWESQGGSPPPQGTTGLYHLAILYPTRAALADALKRLLDHNIPLEGAADPAVSQPLHLRDPDGNGGELYWDRPQDQWPRTPEGGINMYTRPLDLSDLLKAQDEK